MEKTIPVYLVYRGTSSASDSKSKSLRYPPLALGTIMTYALLRDEVRVSFRVVPTILENEETMRAAVSEHGPGVFLFSNYVWSAGGNIALSRLAKDLSPRSLTIHGGPSTPKYEAACAAFFAANPHVDVAVRGEGEIVMAELLPRVARMFFDEKQPRAELAEVASITLRTERGGEEIVRTADGTRVKDLDTIPSPYLTGFFDTMDSTSWLSAIQETNRGCPYGCTFCDWGTVTLQKIYCFSIDRVQAEIDWFAAKRIRCVLLADANFGVFDRDVEIAGLWAKAKERYGYPQQIELNYAKNATRRLTDIVKTLRQGGIIAAGNVAIQTHDEATLKNIHRSNIKTDRYDDLIGIFRREGLPVSSDLLTGLPGQTVASFKSDLQFFIDRRVYASAREVAVLPNSPMAAPGYMEEFGIKIDRRGTVVETTSLPRDAYAKVKRINACYTAALGFGMLKYVAYWLQLEHGIPVMTLLSDLEEHFEAHEVASVSREVIVNAIAMLWSVDLRKARLALGADAWHAFYEEIATFITSKYAVLRDASFDSVLDAQLAVMPRAGKAMPVRIALPHDVNGYFSQLRSVGNLATLDASKLKRLRDFGPGTLEITDGLGLCEVGKDIQITNPWVIEWELDSSLQIEKLDPLASIPEPSVPTIGASTRDPATKRRVLPIKP